MPRPRKSEVEVFENWFFDQKPDDQADILRTLTTLARLRRRQKDPAPERESPQQELIQKEQ